MKELPIFRHMELDVEWIHRRVQGSMEEEDEEMALQNLMEQLEDSREPFRFPLHSGKSH